MQTNPKQTLQYKSVCRFLRRGHQSIPDINIRLHPFSCTRLPTNEICAWLPCYRFQRGPNLPLEIRQLSLSILLFLFLSTPPSLLPHLSCVNTHIRTNLDTSRYVLRISALGSLSSAGCSGGEILQGKLFRAVSEVVRYD